MSRTAPPDTAVIEAASTALNQPANRHERLELGLHENVNRQPSSSAEVGSITNSTGPQNGFVVRLDGQGRRFGKGAGQLPRVL